MPFRAVPRPPSGSSFGSHPVAPAAGIVAPNTTNDRATGSVAPAAEIVTANATSDLATGWLADRLRCADRLLFDSRQPAQAIVVYTEILGRVRDYTALNNRGLAYHLIRQYDAAIADYTEALANHPDPSQLHITLNARGVSYRDKGDCVSAIADFDKAIELNSDYVETHFNRGVACRNIGRNLDAIQSFETFVRLAPSQYPGLITQAKENIRRLQAKP